MNYLATFKVPVTFRLDSDQLKEAQAALNTYYLGDPECNRLNPETMFYEPKYPDRETKEFKDSTNSVLMCRTEYIIVGLDRNGKLSIT